MKLFKTLPLLAVLLTSFFLSPAFAQNRQVYFVDGFHGGVYGHYPKDTYTKFLSDQLDQYPEWSFCLEIEPETWDTVAVRTPEEYRRFAEYTKTPRVEYTNPSYAQPYMYNIHGESVIRQLKYGIKKLHRHFPWMTFETYAVEEPCFTSALPMILTQFGFKYAAVKCPNTCWGGYPASFGGELVNWTGPDGSSILASPRNLEDVLGENVWTTVSNNNRKSYTEACFKAGIKHPVGMCYQDAGWTYGPWLGYGDKDTTGSRYVTWKQYFEDIADRSDVTDWKFTQEDILPGLVWGSDIVNGLTQQVRSAENKIVQTEKLSAMASVENKFLPDAEALDEAWRTLLLSEHHDCWIVPYNGLNQNGNWADNVKLWTDGTIRLSNQIASSALDSFEKGQGHQSNSFYVRVFNTSLSGRKETVAVALPEQAEGKEVVVKDASGKKVSASRNAHGEIVFTADVPAFGYSTYSVSVKKKQIKAAADQVAEGCEIGNEFYTLRFDAGKGGLVTSLVSNEDKYDYAGAEGIGEMKGYFIDEGRFISSSDKPAKVTIRRSPGVSSAFIEGWIGDTRFERTVTLKDGDRKIYVNTAILWDKDHKIGKYAQKDAYANPERAFYDNKYTLNFYVGSSLSDPKVFKNAPFDVCESKLEDTEFSSWNHIKNNVFLDWIDLYDKGSDRGLGVISDHTMSYFFQKGEPLGLTLQYSGNGLWGRNYTITRPNNFSFTIYPHKGRWDSSNISSEDMSVREPLIAKTYAEVPLKNESLVSIDGDGYEVSAAYMTPEGLLLRVFNSSSDDSVRNLRLAFKAGSVMTADLNENPTDKAEFSVSDAGTVIPVSLNRFGIKTFLVKF